MQTTERRSRSETELKEPDRQARSSSSPSEGTPPSGSTGDSTAEVDWDLIFSDPALEEVKDDTDPFEGDAGDPPAAPSLPFTAYPPKRELYEAAFRAAYKYPDALMLVMEGVRKGLKRGKEAAQRAGGQSA